MARKETCDKVGCGATCAVTPIKNNKECQAMMTGCNDGMQLCNTAAQASLDPRESCTCLKKGAACLDALPSNCELARNASSSIVDICTTVGCSATCEAGSLATCDFPKVLSCSKSMSACMEASKTDADRCLCHDKTLSCLGDTYKNVDCRFVPELYGGMLKSCSMFKCPSTCGAVPGCDFEAANKCFATYDACNAAAATDSARCACTKAARACTLDLARKCPLLAGIEQRLGNDCAAAGCSSSTCTTVCVPGRSYVRVDGCNTCTCNPDGKSTTCTRKRCAKECKGVTECRAEGKLCAKDVKMCITQPCPQFKCIDGIGVEARNDANFDGEETDDVDGTTSPSSASQHQRTHLQAAALLLVVVVGALF